MSVDQDERIKPDKALSDLIEEMNESLSKVIREAISVGIGETLLILRDKGILDDD
jgi:dihydropteroate synthase